MLFTLCRLSLSLLFSDNIKDKNDIKEKSMKYHVCL